MPAINKICAQCQNLCKQPATVKLVHCPFFEPKQDFDEALDELLRVESKAAELQARVARFIAEVKREADSPLKA